ncbi:MAG: glycosyltransferase [Verrucomicrobiota bacterium]
MDLWNFGNRQTIAYNVLPSIVHPAKMKSALPKILVVTSFPPDAPGGSAWLLYQLLRGVPSDRVAWWSSSGEAPPHSVERVGSFKSGQLPSRLVPHRRYTQIKAFLLELIWVPLAARSLRAYIKDQNPDLLWILAYSWSIPVLHRAVRGLGIPWHITVHDLADSKGLVASLGAKRAARFQQMVDDLYTGAVSRDVYMKETGEEMERTTGAKADLIIRCGAEPEEIESIRIKTFPPRQEKIRIGYPGTIIAEDTFARFIAALQLIRAEVPVEVNLFGIHSYRDRPWYDHTLIVEHGYLSEEEFDSRYGNCNWGLAIMELDDSNPRYSRFTFPCKFTRSLASGLPVIAIGHPDCTLTRFAGQYQLGPVITSSEPREIADALQAALLKPSDASLLRSEMLRCVNTEFNAELNRKNLHELFRRGAAEQHSKHQILTS